MKPWPLPSPSDDLSSAWCNADAATTSVLEAISFATPVLESFLIRAVADSATRGQDEELLRRCRAFIVDEANHSRAHRKFNAALLDYLGTPPPALALPRKLLQAARTRLSLPRQLLLVAALEHCTAVLSANYLRREPAWAFDSSCARELFARHAAEELAHCSAAVDLWHREGAGSRFARSSTLLAILAAGLLYAVMAVPWIVYRKSGRRLWPTLAALAGLFTNSSRGGPRTVSTLAELFSFARRDFAPDRRVDASKTGAMR